MVKSTLQLVLAGTMIASADAIAQTSVTLFDSTGLMIKAFDPSEINNEVFHLTSEAAFGDELQFLYDNLEQLAAHPIDLRTASWKDLQQIPTLSDLDIGTMRRSRNEFGTLVNAMGRNTHAQDTLSAAGALVALRSMAAADPNASQQAEYRNRTYHGSQIKTISRITARNADFLLSFVEAKDPGEPLYFDHLTGCFAAEHAIPITEHLVLSQFVAGDYSLSFGSGLLFSSTYSSLSILNVINNPVPHSAGIKPYVSSSSFRYFRGAAGEITSGIISVSGFFSDRMIDAALDSNTITALPSTGYHRTTLELSRKEQAESKVAGAHISITPLEEDNLLEFGATAYSLSYNRPVALNGSSPFAFSGQKHSMVSLDMHSVFSAVSCSAEGARMLSDAGYANAFAITFLGAPLKWMEFSVNYRNLPENFISPYGSTFGLNSGDAQNETGWYAASRVTVIPGSLSFFGSVNFSRSLSQDRSAVQYSDIIIGSEYHMKLVPVVLLFLYRSYGKGPVFSIAGDSLSKNSLRLDAHADLGKKISVSLRADIQRSFSITDNLSHMGHLYGVKMAYEPARQLRVASGIMFFETDSYASRLYSNEEDLPGSAPFVALYGVGHRYYLQLSCDLSGKARFSARIAGTRYPGLSSINQPEKITVGTQFDLAL